jgi:hypothetical protein
LISKRNGFVFFHECERSRTNDLQLSKRTYQFVRLRRRKKVIVKDGVNSRTVGFGGYDNAITANFLVFFSEKGNRQEIWKTRFDYLFGFGEDLLERCAIFEDLGRES